MSLNLEKCKNFIKELNTYPNNHLIFITDKEQKIGVRKRSICFCFDRLWAWWNGASYNKNRIAEKVIEIFNHVELDQLDIPPGTYQRFYDNLSKLNTKFNKSKNYNQMLQPIITKLLNINNSFNGSTTSKEKNTLLRKDIQIVEGTLNSHFVKGDLNLTNQKDLKYFPDGFKTTGNLTIENCVNLSELPRNFEVGGNLKLISTTLQKLPEGLKVKGNLILCCINLESLPNNFEVEGDLMILRCPKLRSLPKEPNVKGTINLKNWAHPQGLPENFKPKKDVDFMGNKNLRSLPKNLNIPGYLNLEDCVNLEELPEDLEVGSLNLTNCLNLQKLSKNLKVRDHLKFENCSKLEELPEDLEVGNKLSIIKCNNLKLKKGFESKCELYVVNAKHIPFASQEISNVNKTIENLEIDGTSHLGSTKKLIKNGSFKTLIIKNRNDFQKLSSFTCENLIVENCPSFEQLSKEVKITYSLSIINCPNIKQLPSLPYKGLTIKDCPKLELPFLTCNILTVENCPNLKKLLKKVKVIESLTIKNCLQIEQLPFLTCKSLRLENCPKFEQLPKGSNPCKRLTIINCPNIKQLPKPSRSYERCTIKQCPDLEKWIKKTV